MSGRGNWRVLEIEQSEMPTIIHPADPSGRVGVSFFLIVLLAVLTNGAGPRPSDKPSASGPALAAVTVRGRVVCLPEEMHRRHGVELPGGHGHIWALRTANGDLYTILPGRYAEGIFQDERIRAKELQVRARVLPKSQAIEILTVYSVRDGVVHDLYYYCDICAIKSVSPEICACCQGPVELTEKPLSQRED